MRQATPLLAEASINDRVETKGDVQLLKTSPPTLDSFDRPPRRFRRGLTVIGLIAGVLVLATTAAIATNHVYKNGDAPSGTYNTSGVDDIYGGYVESNDGGLCYACNTEVRTTLSWYPYYVYAAAEGGRSASLSHGVQSNTRSRCKHWWSGGVGTMHKYCYYQA